MVRTCPAKASDEGLRPVTDVVDVVVKLRLRQPIPDEGLDVWTLVLEHALERLELVDQVEMLYVQPREEPV